MAETLEDLQKKIKLYEQNGAAKLYYALNRKMNEMGDLMNKNNLSTLSIDDPKDKTFERLKVIWGDAASIAAAVEALGKIAKVTGVEEKDVDNKPFIETVAETRT